MTLEYNQLKILMLEGKSSREIGEITNHHKNTVLYWIKKYKLEEFQNYKKPIYNESFFNKINTKEQAYCLGFLLGDSYLTEKTLELTIALKDKETLDFIANQLQAILRIDETFLPNKRRFPRVRINIGNKNLLVNLYKLFGGYKKEDRHIPIIKKEIERYLILGFFDAEGSISWGYRVDRNRIWQKISFTSQYKMLIGIQKILDKNEISSIIRPKTNENCYVLEFSSKNMVLKFLNYIYPNNDFIIMKRKYLNANALRLELGENGEV